MATAKGIIAVDFGGVCSRHHRHAPGEEHTNIKMNMPFCVETLRKLAVHNRLVLVSYCGRRRAIETRDEINRVCPGLFEDLLFVRDKSKKGDVCAAIGAAYLIDDSPAVLKTVRPPCEPVYFTDWSTMAHLRAPPLPQRGGTGAVRELLHEL